MELYKNIKRRRLELNLSQSELASKVGYKDKGSISRIENGLLDLTQSQIEDFAKALECSPAYLMGWSDDKEDKAVLNILDRLRDSIRSSIVLDLFHDLRHYSTSILHALGLPDAYIMEHNGYASDYVMKSVYRHSLSDKTIKYNKIANDYVTNNILNSNYVINDINE